MPALRSLNVSNNEIRVVPAELGFATQLQALLLEGNPQKTVRQAVIAQGTAAIVAYLATRMPEGQEPSSTAWVSGGSMAPPAARLPAAAGANFDETPVAAARGVAPAGMRSAPVMDPAVSESQAVIAQAEAEMNALQTQLQSGSLSAAMHFAVREFHVNTRSQPHACVREQVKKQIAQLRASILKEQRKMAASK